jgi:hypothetical protein
MGNVAYVCKKINGEEEECIIDRAGKFITKRKLYDLLFNKVKEKYRNREHGAYLGDYLWFINNSKEGLAALIPDYFEGKYNFLCRSERHENNHGYLITKDSYKIDIDTPIKDIDFNTNSKVKKKVI